jgi:hypothetical protein
MLAQARVAHTRGEPNAEPAATSHRCSCERLDDRLASLIAALHELIDRLGPPATAPSDELTLAAGPFARLEAVHAFALALERQPGVESATVRGYAGADRAIVDVRLSKETA